MVTRLRRHEGAVRRARRGRAEGARRAPEDARAARGEDRRACRAGRAREAPLRLGRAAQAVGAARRPLLRAEPRAQRHVRASGSLAGRVPPGRRGRGEAGARAPVPLRVRPCNHGRFRALARVSRRRAEAHVRGSRRRAGGGGGCGLACVAPRGRPRRAEDVEAEDRAAAARVRPVRRRLPAPLVARRSRARVEDLPPAGVVLAGRARRRPRGRDLGARASRSPPGGADRAVLAVERGEDAARSRRRRITWASSSTPRPTWRSRREGRRRRRRDRGACGGARAGVARAGRGDRAPRAGTQDRRRVAHRARGRLPRRVRSGQLSLAQAARRRPLRGARPRGRADRAPARERALVRATRRRAPSAARGPDGARPDRPRRARAEHASLPGGQAAPRRRGGSPTGAAGRGRVDRLVRHPAPWPGGLRAPRRAAHDRDLRRRRRAALAAGDVPAAPRARARARKRPPWPPRASACRERSLALSQPACRHGDARAGRRRRPPAHDDPPGPGRRAALGALRVRMAMRSSSTAAGSTTRALSCSRRPRV